MFFNFILIFWATLGSLNANTIDDSLVEYYKELINNLTQKALAYEFPTDARMYRAQNTTVEEFGHYDFIVIGAGTAGCVVANRLSEVPHWNVLLLEAGGYPDEELTGIPSLATQEAFTKFDWGFLSVPQTTAFLGNVNQTCYVRRGKGIGGTSLINGMAYSKGHKLDYEIWANMVSNDEWSYDNLLPYFKKSEKFTRKNFLAAIDYEYHGYDGVLAGTHSIPPQSETLDFLRGLEELGYNTVDYNGIQEMGGSIFQLNTEYARRFDAGKGYIKPALYRKNLRVLDWSYVTKIQISKSTKKVEGVVFTRNNKTYIARNNLEVILSGGTISSPQILMLSGIGQQDHLESLGIPVLENLPVGSQILDHPTTNLIFSTNVKNNETTEDAIRDLLQGRGSYTRGNKYDAVMFVKTDLEETPDYPDLEFTFKGLINSAIAKKVNRFNDETFNTLNVSVDNGFIINMFLLHSKSVGTVRLDSADPFEYPRIDPNLYSDERDLERMYQGIQLIYRLLDTEGFRKLNVTLALSQFPGCNEYKSGSRNFWYCYMRRVTAPGNHQVGSCPMARTPQTGVVDSKLKVFNVEGLRVADCSVVPVVITGHTNSACTVVGEKASDLIKQAHKFGYVSKN